MRRTIFMTGATGTVGSELLRRLMTREDTTINILVRRAGYDRRPQIEYGLRGIDARATLNVLDGDLCAGDRADARGFRRYQDVARLSA
jgi:uncharacterized protein YbjT (DUF2867 family)